LNLSKSSRYHRARRRAEALAGLLTVGLLGVLILTPASVALRGLVGGSVAGYSAVVLGLLGILQLPLSIHRQRLERQYQLIDVTAAGWLAGQVKTAVVALAIAVPLAEFVYWTMRWPDAWWLLAAGGTAAVGGLLTAVAPVVLLPLVHRSRPLSRDELRDRLERLSARAGVPVLDVHELPLGERSRRASAALVGAGATRRILLSDTLLANYSDDEIEVVMAHEMGHHVHRHTMKAMAVEVLLLFAGFRLAASLLEANWRSLGLTSIADVAGLPLIVLSVAGVMLLATPLLNAWSRAHERRADRFALETASEPAAFVGAVRRMAAHNLAEEHPSSAAFLLFHTHPTVEERVSAALALLQRRRTEP
jgi:STE24 endopeptidase